jgi:transcriptional regulator with XRE-family HTH domain
VESIYKHVGLKIKKERIKAGLTQQQLARISDMQLSFLGDIERGQKKISLNALEKIAAGLNSPVSYLLDRDD